MKHMEITKSVESDLKTRNEALVLWRGLDTEGLDEVVQVLFRYIDDGIKDVRWNAFRRIAS